MKNIVSVLAALTLAYAGYYFFVQKSDLESEDGVAFSQDILVNTQIFIERRAVIDTLKVDTELFANPVFASYKSFTRPVVGEPIGRDNPFGRTTLRSNTDTI